MRIPALLLVVAVACAAAPRRPAGQIDIWVPPGADEALRKEWAEALAGNAPPASDELPAHDLMRRINYAVQDDADWRVLFVQARGYARSLDADAVILLPGGWHYIDNWTERQLDSEAWKVIGFEDHVRVDFVIVRYR